MLCNSSWPRDLDRARKVWSREVRARFTMFIISISYYVHKTSSFYLSLSLLLLLPLYIIQQSFWTLSGTQIYSLSNARDKRTFHIYRFLGCCSLRNRSNISSHSADFSFIFYNSTSWYVKWLRAKGMVFLSRLKTFWIQDKYTKEGTDVQNSGWAYFKVKVVYMEDIFDWNEPMVLSLRSTKVIYSPTFTANTVNTRILQHVDWDLQVENWPIKTHLYKNKFSLKNKTCSYLNERGTRKLV